MQCHECGNAVASDDRFCTACGASLSAITEATQPLPAVDPDRTSDTEPTSRIDTLAALTDQASDSDDSDNDDSDNGDVWGDDDPVWAATGTVDAVGNAVPPPPTTDQLPATEPITEVRPRTDESVPGRFDPEEVPDPWAEPARMGAVAATPHPTAELPVFPTAIRERRPFRLTAVLGLSALGAAVTLLALFATVVSVTSDDRITRTPETPPQFRTGDWISTDLASNLPLAGLVAVCLLMAGGVASAFHWRGGSGLAGGAGLAIAGLAALTIGLAQIPIDAAYEMAAIPTEQQFTLVITRDIGYWLLLAAGAIGIVVFFASLNDAFGDHRSGLNPWIAAVGALSGLVMAGGPLIPEGLATFSDNWYVGDAPGEPPAMLLTGRLVQLALLALTVVIGFLSVRRWGLGVAVGGCLSSIWLTVSTMFEVGENPIGPGFRNPGSTTMEVHGVTIIGASALVAFSLLAIVAAYDQASRGY